MELNYSSFSRFLPNVFDATGVKKVATGVSGGSDSMSLVFLLNEFCKSRGIELIAITVDHKLRKKSTEETSSISTYLKKHNIKHIFLTWKHENIKSNIQKKARDARYKLICNYCIKNSVKHLFIAHNYDDQAETVMLRILRGSGIDGVAGISPISTIHEIIVIRPLLNFKKTQIIEFLKKENIVYFEDPSNKNTNFDRVKVRQLLEQFDYNNHLKKRLNLLAENASRASSFLIAYVNRIFNRYCFMGKYGHISIKYSDFLNLDEEIKLRLINKIIKYIHNNPLLYHIRLYSLKLLLNNLQSNKSKKFTLSKCIIMLHKQILYFFKENKFIEPIKQLLKGSNIWDNRYKVDINTGNFYVTRLTKEIWNRVKPKKYIHTVPIEIIFSTPIILSENKKQCYSPFNNLFNSLIQNRFDAKINITHIPSNSSFEIKI